MGMTFDEAVAAVTAPGQPFSIVEADVARQPLKVFEHTPPSLRALFDSHAAAGRRRRSSSTRTSGSASPRSWPRPTPSAPCWSTATAWPRATGSPSACATTPSGSPSYMAAISIGAVAVSLNAWWTADEMIYGLEDSGTKVLIADQERAERAEGAFDTARHPHRRGALDGPLPAGRRSARGRRGARARPCRRSTIDPDDDATILYTSGTTGHPKGAVSRPTGPCSAPSWPSAAGPRPTRSMDPPTEPPRPTRPRSSWSCRCSTSPAAWPSCSTRWPPAPSSCSCTSGIPSGPWS